MEDTLSQLPQVGDELVASFRHRSFSGAGAVSSSECLLVRTYQASGGLIKESKTT